ncbi:MULTISPECIES: hypothetical protein [Paenibacillus]|uniref:Uncharacterized protein n=1 Tax=Paenibacillus ehimensis TaxID=79264 RepID=A0ABT8VKY5_9BACL|nr:MULTISPECIES: hypothetical protein [Paenibacillus]MDO3681655.1 hypothetical protein [Paenibacillus ehimensis]MEC0211430.1 hypothetical protein [Paenibacillus ehimensis]
MGKLVIACLLTVLLGGAAMFVAGTKVGPAVGGKGTKLYDSVTQATVNQTSGEATLKQP